MKVVTAGWIKNLFGREVRKLCRLAGADHLHVNGFNSKFYESNESVLRSIQACTSPLLGGYHSMPVISSMQWAGTAPVTYEATHTLLPNFSRWQLG